MPRTITKTLTRYERDWIVAFCDRYGTQSDVARDIGCTREHLSACIRPNPVRKLSVRPLYKRLLRLAVAFELDEFDGDERLDALRFGPSHDGEDGVQRDTVRELEGMIRKVREDRARLERQSARDAVVRERGVVRVGVPT